MIFKFLQRFGKEKIKVQHKCSQNESLRLSRRRMRRWRCTRNETTPDAWRQARVGATVALFSHHEHPCLPPSLIHQFYTTLPPPKRSTTAGLQQHRSLCRVAIISFIAFNAFKPPYTRGSQPSHVRKRHHHACASLRQTSLLPISSEHRERTLPLKKIRERTTWFQRTLEKRRGQKAAPNNNSRIKVPPANLRGHLRILNNNYS